MCPPFLALRGSLTAAALQLVFYGAYHNNKVNFLIHVIGVPLLFWSA